MLNKEEIADLIAKKKLVEGYVDLEKQLTPNGFDVTVGMIYSLEGQGQVDFSNEERVLPKETEVSTSGASLKGTLAKGTPQWWELAPGVYKVKTNETVNMPLDLTALAYTRTTLLRMGVFTCHGVWDAGFCGKSEFTLVVQNPHGVRIKRNARVAQLVFLPLKEVRQGYAGIYQHKK
jgi:dUTP pyrophosphatase